MEYAKTKIIIFTLSNQLSLQECLWCRLLVLCHSFYSFFFMWTMESWTGKWKQKPCCTRRQNPFTVTIEFFWKYWLCKNTKICPLHQDTLQVRYLIIIFVSGLIIFFRWPIKCHEFIQFSHVWNIFLHHLICILVKFFQECTSEGQFIHAIL